MLKNKMYEVIALTTAVISEIDRVSKEIQHTFRTLHMIFSFKFLPLYQIKGD